MGYSHGPPTFVAGLFVFFFWCEDLRFGSFSERSLFCFDPPLTPQLKNWLASWRKPTGNQPKNPVDELSSQHKQQEIVQDYRWVTHIDYVDSEKCSHCLHLLACEETKPNRQGSTSTNTHKWLTNFIPTWTNVDTLANQGGRLRWKFENEGFNVQKNGGFNLEHPYSQDGTARKVFYFLLQIAHMIFLLMEKGSLFRNSFPNGVGSLKNIAFRLLEAWRNLRLSPAGFCSLYKGRYYIRFDSS